MQTETAKMIYPTQQVANMIAGKLTKHKGVKHAVIKVTTGWQVAAVTVCAGAVSPHKATPIATPDYQVEAKAPVEQLDPSVVVLLFKLKAEHPKTVHIVAESDGEVKWLHKSVMIGYTIDAEAGTVAVKYRKKVADKKGFYAWAMIDKPAQAA